MSEPTTPRGTAPRERLRGVWHRLSRWLNDEDATAAGRLPRFFLVFLLIFGVSMIVISLIGDQGLIAYLGLRSEARSLEARVIELETQREELLAEIEALRADPEFIAYLARKRLGLVKPGEVVVQLPRGASR